MTVTASKVSEGIADLYARFPASRAYIDAIAAKKNEKAKRQSAAGLRALLFLLDERGVDTAPLVIERTENGKPYFANSGIKFGISHSGEVAVCALSDSEVGIDIEEIREVGNAEALAKRYFAEEEGRYVAASEDASAALLEVWTKKEAALKRDGRGIATDLRAADLGSPQTRTYRRDYFGKEYFVTVCSEDGEMRFV